jgi:hypothetical protein
MQNLHHLLATLRSHPRNNRNRRDNCEEKENKSSVLWVLSSMMLSYSVFCFFMVSIGHIPMPPNHILGPMGAIIADIFLEFGGLTCDCTVQMQVQSGRMGNGLVHASSQSLWNGGEERGCYMVGFILVSYMSYSFSNLVYMSMEVKGPGVYGLCF